MALSVILAGLPSSAAWSGSSGAEPFEFLFLDADARAVGMGGAYCSLATDSNALLYNPAGLGLVDRRQATFMHNQFVEDVSQEYLAFAHPRGWGVSLNRFDFGRIERTTIANPNGSGGRFELTDTALSGGLGRVVGEGLSAGVAAKWIRETVDDVSVSAWAADAGLLYRPPSVDGLALAAAMQNLGPSARFANKLEPMPLAWRLGSAYRLSFRGHEHTLAFDLSLQRHGAPIVDAGLESVVAEAFAVRLGFNGRNDADIGLTLGLGWRRPDWSFDYAFVPFGALGDAHRVSATLRWGPVAAHPARPSRTPASESKGPRPQPFWPTQRPPGAPDPEAPVIPRGP